VALTLYWPRFNALGAIAGMLSGFLTHVAFYGIGWWTTGSFRPYTLGNFDPFIPELIVSGGVCLVAAACTKPPQELLVRKYFCRDTQEVSG
jgi:Na+/proline symporter